MHLRHAVYLISDDFEQINLIIASSKNFSNAPEI